MSVRGGRRLRDGILRVAGPRGPRMFWWRGRRNFGDEMAPAVVEWALGSEPVWVSSSYQGKVVAQGSILSHARRGDVVWGSGSIDGSPFDPPDGCRILAVRGPLTRRTIRGDVPKVYGDPALLLPRFCRDAVKKTFQIGVVPHVVDREEVLTSLSKPDPAILVIDVSYPWQEVVRSVRSCEAIISSSLHGLIVAEAYGIPASWIRVTDRIEGGQFKFNDHYLATARDEMRPTPWEAGLAKVLSAVAPPLVLDTQPLLESLQRVGSARRGNSFPG
jgi:pyruvyltransferase